MSAAKPLARVLRHARFEVKNFFLNGEQLLVSLVFPTLGLLGLVYSENIPLGSGTRISFAVPGALALCVVSNAFTVQAISTGFDRRYGVIRLFGVSPLGATGLLAAKAVAVGALLFVQTTLLVGIGLWLGWRPQLVGIIWALFLLVLGAYTFVSWALSLAGTLRAEGVLAFANLIWVFLAGAGALLLPSSVYPRWWAPITEWLPSGALGNGLRSAFITGTFPLLPLLILFVWAAIGTYLMRRYFRWSD